MWRGVLLETLDTDRVQSAVVALEDSPGPVLVVAHTRHAHRAATVASLLQAHRPDLLVAHAHAGAAPVALLAALAVARDRAADAGHAVEVWRAVLAGTWSGAVLPSVTRLSSPNPTVLQHVRSWWPPSRFLVRLHPEPAAAPAERLTDLLQDVPRSGTDAVVSEGGATDPTVEALLAHTSPRTVRPEAVPGDWRDVLSRRDLGQVALLPADLDAVVPAPGTPCGTCGLSVAAPVCPFCRVRLDRAEPDPAPLPGPPDEEQPALAEAGTGALFPTPSRRTSR